jgi:hypothetical protein
MTNSISGDREKLSVSGPALRTMTLRRRGLALAILLAVAGVAAYLAWQASREASAFRNLHQPNITSMGKDLIDHRGSNLFAGPHEGLNAKLDELGVHAATGYDIIVNHGDAPPGDGQATQHFFLERRADHTKILGVRVRFDPSSQKYHMAGYWTPFKT